MQEIRAARDRATRRFDAGFAETYMDGDVGNRCIIRRRNEGGGYPYLPTNYGSVAQIFQAPGYVVVLAAMIHTARIIPLDGRPRPGPALKAWLGYPYGHWEGNTLVIETVNFHADAGFGCERGCNTVYANANPSTFTIVERFTRTGPERLEYQVTIDEPLTWARPFTVSLPWNRVHGRWEQVYEYACNETNYDMYHFLSQARKREAAGERFDPNAPVVAGRE
jgi:hypothetical protein